MERDETALALVLARNIKALRGRRGWTQAELAQRIELTPHYVALLETAQRLPTLKALLALAGALGVTSDQLLATSSTSKDERHLRIATRIASAPEQTQVLIEDVVDVILKGTGESKGRKKAKRKS